MNAAMQNTCPCCGQSWDSAGPEADAKRILFPLLDKLPGQRASLLRYLLDHFGEWSPRKKMADYVYRDDINGGPENCDGVVAVQLTNLRRHIAPFGFEIDSKPHSGSRLRRSLYPEHAK